MARKKRKTADNYINRTKMRIAFWILLLFLFAGVTVFGALISYDYVTKNFIKDSQGEAVVVDEREGVEFIIERGAGTSQIAKDLAEQGLIKDETIFKLLSKINGYDGTYKSGTHIVSKELDYDDMMRVLSSAPAVRRVTIPEGKTFTQIADILYEKKIIKDKTKFINIANTEKFDYSFLEGLPKRDNRLEGYLFPDTYEYDYNVADEDVIIKMLDNFNKKFKAAYRELIPELPYEMSIDKVVILASIIEKEAKNVDDRYIISGVLYNRLTNKDKTLNKLQVDATVQYILLKKTGSYKDRVLYADLEIDDPYNTYIYEGLPPGPICCPGEAAIKAAINPEDTKYLYYVARGDEEGTHQFSVTYQQHQAAIKKYGNK